MQRIRVNRRGSARRSDSPLRDWLILLALLLIATAANAQQDIEETVSRLLAEGDTGGAKRALRSWLLTNGETNNFPIQLERYLSLETDISVVREFLTRLLELKAAKAHHVVIWQKRAILEELSGRIDTAQEAYQRAADLSLPERKPPLLLDSARLLFEQGFNQKAGETLSQIFLISQDVEVNGRAMLLRSYIYIEGQEYVEAQRVLRSIVENPGMVAAKPAALLALIYLNREKPEEYAAYQAALKEEFPQSPEYDLAQEMLGKGGDISLPFTPRRYLDSYVEEESEVSKNEETAAAETLPVEKPEEKAVSRTEEARKVYVQTGSFLDRENAEYMVLDLRKLGLRADIMVYKKDDKTYYRVVLIDIENLEQAQKRLLELKNQGFEGFITFGDREETAP
jgi:tetratricopeptide (TPR) repeat protein